MISYKFGLEYLGNASGDSWDDLGRTRRTAGPVEWVGVESEKCFCVNITVSLGSSGLEKRKGVWKVMNEGEKKGTDDHDSVEPQRWRYSPLTHPIVGVAVLV